MVWTNTWLDVSVSYLQNGTIHQVKITRASQPVHFERCQMLKCANFKNSRRRRPPFCEKIKVYVSETVGYFNHIYHGDKWRHSRPCRKVHYYFRWNSISAVAAVLNFRKKASRNFASKLICPLPKLPDAKMRHFQKFKTMAFDSL